MASRYRVQMIIIGIVLAFPTSLLISIISSGILYGFESLEAVDLTPLLPFNNYHIEFPLTVIITIVSCIVGSYSMGFVLGPALLYLHKKILGRKLKYGIQEKRNTIKFKKTFRGFFPMLMAINFALIIVQDENLALLFIEEAQLQIPGLGYVFAIFVMVMVFSGVTMGIFSPIWFILDSGIVYIKKENKDLSNKLIEVRSVGGWFLILLKGYSSISIIFTFGFFMLQQVAYATKGELYFEWYIILLIVGLFLIPIFFSLLALPSIIFLDKLYEKRRNYMLKFAKKIGIVDSVDQNTLFLAWGHRASE
ncbi:MAG: hypothetical protein ACXADU_18170 [Promethearchaeota archaeon]